MGLRDDITSYAAARNWRFIPAAVLAFALLLVIVLARRASDPSTDRLVWVALLAVVGLVFMAYFLWDFQWRPRSKGHLCPHCREPLVAHAERAVIATGRCLKCKREIT
jgi:hypothetical protein